jgi:hypothetical protein
MAVMSYDTPAKKLGINVAESTSTTIHATIISRWKRLMKELNGSNLELDTVCHPPAA